MKHEFTKTDHVAEPESLVHKAVQTTGADSTIERDELATAKDPSLRNDRSCVDLKSLVKMKKLCCMLRTHVIELQTVYEKRCSMGFMYTRSEHIGLNVGLRTLEEDMLRMLVTLDEINGYRDEIKHVVSVYTRYESRFREYRMLIKNAKLRNHTSGKTIENTDDNVRGLDDRSKSSDVPFIIKYLCDPFFKLYKRVFHAGRKLGN